MTEEQTQKKMPSLTAICTLLLAIVAVFTFFSTSKQAEIYYSTETTGIQIPKALDSDDIKIRKCLSDKNIPTDTISISVLNNGNIFAENVNVSIKVSGSLLTYSSIPKPTENPAWIELPQKIDLSKKPDNTKLEIKNFGTTKTAIFEFKYQRKTHDIPEIEIFYNGNPAKKVLNVSDISLWESMSIHFIFFKIVPALGVFIFAIICLIGIGALLYHYMVKPCRSE